MLHSVLVRQANAPPSVSRRLHRYGINIIERRAILDFSWRLAMSVRDNPRIRDREGRSLHDSVVGQQSASHAGRSTMVVSAKIKSRTQIRRADKIELKIAI
jgi:hypothetical protein